MPQLPPDQIHVEPVRNVAFPPKLSAPDSSATEAPAPNWDVPVLFSIALLIVMLARFVPPPTTRNRSTLRLAPLLMLTRACVPLPAAAICRPRLKLPVPEFENVTVAVWAL